jgi:septum formation inhibitor MinC
MTISTNDLLNSILESFDRIGHIQAEDIPNIDLYMDQVTTFMEQHMRATTRNPEEDKILTKTMINNYAKNDLLPPPVKKKYSKEHVLVLIFIYYFKGILSIGDIQELLSPLTEKYFHAESGIKMEDIYEEVFSLEGEKIESLKEDVKKMYHASTQTFQQLSGKEQEFLQQFSFICMLSYDVYVKKLLIEKMIDSMREEKQNSNQKPEGKKAETKKTDAKKAETKKAEKPKAESSKSAENEE